MRIARTAAAKLGVLPVAAGLGAVGIYGAALAPATVFVLLMLILLPWLVPGFHHRKLQYDKGAANLVRYSLSTYPAALLGGAPLFFLPLIALAVVGSRGTAYFYVAWNLLAVLLIVPAIISNMSLSEGSRDLTWRMADRAWRFAISIMVPLTLALIVVASPTLSLFGQKYAANGAWPLRIFAISLIPWTFMSINQAALRADARHRDLALVSLLFAVMTLAGPVALGLLLGLNGLAGGWTLGVFVTSASLAVLAVRHRREERGGRSPPPRGTPIAGPGSPA